MRVHVRGRECEPQWGANELGDAATNGVGEKMEKSSLVCCDGRVVLFLSPAFCAVDSSMLKNISVLLRWVLRVLAWIRNFAVGSVGAHKALLSSMSRFRREDARSRATMKHTQPDFLCLQLLLFLYLCLVFAAEAVGCRICRVNRRPFAKRVYVAGAASLVPRMPSAPPPFSTLENPWKSSVSSS